MSDLDLDSTMASEAAPADVPPVVEDIEPDHYYGGGKIPVFKPVSFGSSLEPLCTWFGLWDELGLIDGFQCGV